MRGRVVELSPITSTDIGPVSVFLNTHLNPRVTAEAWARAMEPPWPGEQPNHGFFLSCEGDVIGAYLAFYSERDIDGEQARFCNLAAWCVLEEHRSQGLRLIRALLSQRGYTFTDFSPSGNVIEINKRLRFSVLDSTTALVANLPVPPRRGVRILTEPADIRQALAGRDLSIYLDHEDAAAARHLVVVKGEETCYVMFRRDRRKGLPLFATILHVGNGAVFVSTRRHVFGHLLLHHRLPATLLESRVAGTPPWGSFALKNPRPRMYRSSTVRDSQIDYLYSELACVAW